MTAGSLWAGSGSAGTPLAIRPPDGFTVKQSTPDSDADTGYEVSAVSDPDTGCQVNLTRTRAPLGPDQPSLNAIAATPRYFAGVEADLVGLFHVRDVAPFAMQGADGAIVIADPKAGEGALRAMIVDIDTPRGSLEVLCAAAVDEFDAWRPIFDRIARGVELPR